MHTKRIDTHAYTVADLCYKHTHTHMRANCQERCLEREDPCHLLSHPARLFWLPNCQSPLSTTSHAEKQMSACHFSRHLTLKCSPFFVHLQRQRDRQSCYCIPHSSLYLWMKARVRKLTLDMIIAIVCHLPLPGDNLPASLWVSGFQNVPQGHFRAIDFQRSQGEISGDVLLGTYGHFRAHMLGLALSEAGSIGKDFVSGSGLTLLNLFKNND